MRTTVWMVGFALGFFRACGRRGCPGPRSRTVILRDRSDEGTYGGTAPCRWWVLEPPHACTARPSTVSL
jgi:hypothetical protein